jgi:hypothetical protein
MLFYWLFVGSLQSRWTRNPKLWPFVISLSTFTRLYSHSATATTIKIILQEDIFNQITASHSIPHAFTRVKVNKYWSARAMIQHYAITDVRAQSSTNCFVIRTVGHFLTHSL